MTSTISPTADRSAPSNTGATRALSTRFVAVALAALGLLGLDEARAATTYAYARVQLSGLPTVIDEREGGSAGAQAGASLQIGSAASFVSGSASAGASVGGVSVQTRADANIGGSVDGVSAAQWADGFTIVASGHAPGTMGTFTAAVGVSGSLIADAETAIADSFIIAEFRLDTDVANGNFIATGGGRRTVGGSLPAFSGQENFQLIFANVPFEFGRPISVTLRLYATSQAIAFNNGGFARARADYGQSMTWAGMSNLRDAAGNPISAFNALSTTSGFDFANATPVPEPASVGLLLLGLGAVAWQIKRRPKAGRS